MIIPSYEKYDEGGKNASRPQLVGGGTKAHRDQRLDVTDPRGKWIKIGLFGRGGADPHPASAGWRSIDLWFQSTGWKRESTSRQNDNNIASHNVGSYHPAATHLIPRQPPDDVFSSGHAKIRFK